MSTLDHLRVVAAEQAAALDADFVGTEHLFLAWLVTAHGPLADTCAAAGLTPDAFRTLLGSAKARRRGPGPATEPGGLSSQAQRVIDLAAEDATAAGRAEPTPDDVMLAMIKEPRGFVARALSDHELKPSKLRTLTGERAELPVRAERPEREPRTPREPRPERKERPPRAPAQTDDAPKSDAASRGASRRSNNDDTDFIPMPPAPSRPRPTPRTVPAPEPSQTPKRRFSLLSVLFLAIPVAIWLYLSHADPLATFIVACVGVLPLAGLMGTATEHLAERTGPTLGGLLNATFGNAAELIIALAALRQGYVELVKASITGSILGNLLLILGLSLIAGGRKSSLIQFNRTNAGMSSAMLALAVAGLVFPAIFHSVHPEAAALEELYFSEAVATILIITYLLSLLFVLRTHRPLFSESGDKIHALDGRAWSVRKAVGVLAIATVGVATMSEILVHAVGPVTESLGVSQAFLGLIVIPIIGNAAEHGTAVVAAHRGKTDLALQIALGSSTQIALLVAPVLVFAGAFLGTPGMNLVFPPFEVVGLGIAVITSAIITLDGESHWFEGVQLLALYAMVGAAAWFI